MDSDSLYMAKTAIDSDGFDWILMVFDVVVMDFDRVLMAWLSS